MRKIRALITVCFFIATVSALYKTGLLNSICVPSACRKICIPVFFWSAVFTYSLTICVAYFGSAWRAHFSLRNTVIFGFFFHIYLLLSGLIASLTGGHSFLSSVYFYYIKGCIVLFTLIISSAACFLAYRHNIKTVSRDEWPYSLLFFLPLFTMPVFFTGIEIMPVDKPFFTLILLACAIPYIVIKIPIIPALIEKARKFTRALNYERNFVISIFIIAFFIRCLFGLNIIAKTETAGANSFITASDDGDVFDRKAQALIENGFDLKKAGAHVWGGRWDDAYAIFLAAIYKVFGRNFYVVCFIQAFIGAILPVFMFFLGKMIFSRQAGMFAALAASLKGPFIFLSIVLGHEAIWLPLLVLFILILTKLYKGYRPIYAISAGCILGLILIFRGLFVYLVPLLFFWIIFFWKNVMSIRERAKSIVLIGAALFLVIFAVMATTGSGFSFGEPGRIRTQWDVERLYEPFKGIGNERLSSIGVNFAVDPAGSVKTIFKDPFPFLKTAAYIYPLRIVAYLEVYQFGFFDPIYLINSANFPNYFMSNLEFYFTLFFIVGLVLCITKRKVMASPVFMILTFHVIIYALVFCNMAPRYKDASSPFVYLIGSFGFVEILRFLKARKGEG